MNCKNCGAIWSDPCNYCGTKQTEPKTRERIESDMGYFESLEDTILIGDMNTVKGCSNCEIHGDMNVISGACPHTIVSGDMNTITRSVYKLTYTRQGFESE